MAYSIEDYVAIGQGIATPDVLREADLAIERWRTDLGGLMRYGFTAAKLDQLIELRGRLEGRYRLYLGQVGVKIAARPAEQTARQALVVWYGEARSNLETLGEENREVGAQLGRIRLAGSRPQATAKAATAMLELLQSARSRLDPAVVTDEFVAEGEQLLAALRDATRAKDMRKDSKEVGTAELDEIDGRIAVRIAGLNRAGRRLHRARRNADGIARYRLHFLGHDTSEVEDAAPVAAEGSTGPG